MYHTIMTNIVIYPTHIFKIKDYRVIHIYKYIYNNILYNYYIYPITM